MEALNIAPRTYCLSTTLSVYSAYTARAVDCYLRCCGRRPECYLTAQNLAILHPSAGDVDLAVGWESHQLTTASGRRRDYSTSSIKRWLGPSHHAQTCYDALLTAVLYDKRKSLAPFYSTLFQALGNGPGEDSLQKFPLFINSISPCNSV